MSIQTGFFETKNTFLHISTDDCSKVLRKCQSSPSLQARGTLSISSLDTACDLSELPSPASSNGSLALSLAEDAGLLTTIMVRNIPCKYTQKQMMSEVSEVNSNFDFLYIPPARTAKVDKNLGYAFINFKTVSDAQSFMEGFQNHKFNLYKKSTKRAVVTYAELQGFEANVKYYRKAKVSRTKFRPFILRA
jgi:RNA recognition motif-containing protein